jgi:hypothetical protein
VIGVIGSGILVIAMWRKFRHIVPDTDDVLD